MTPRWLTKRGFKGDVQLDYVLGQKSRGDVFGSFLPHDQRVNSNTDKYPYDDSRWSTLGTQDFFLPLDSRLKSKFTLVSDNDYVIDFSELRDSKLERFLESNVFLGRSFGPSGRFGLVTSGTYADDLQSPDNQDRDDFLLQRFGHVDVAALSAPLGFLARLVPDLDVQFTNFQPISEATDELPLNPTVDMMGNLLTGATVVGDNLFLDTGIDALPNRKERGSNPNDPTDPNRDDAPGGSENDGRFQEGEPLADKGQRLVLTPRLAIPFRLADLVEVYPEVGWNQTLWNTSHQGFEERGGFLARADARTQLQRRLGRTITHVFEPQLGYALSTKDSGDNDPLFVPGTAVPQQRIRQLDLDNTVLDPADRVDNLHLATFGFNNRFYRRRGRGRGPQLMGDLTVSSGYDIKDERFALLVADGRAYPWQGASLRFSLGYDPQKTRLNEALGQFSWRHDAGHFLSVRYRYLRDAPEFFEDFDSGKRFDQARDQDRVSQINAQLRLALTQRWSVSYNIAYSFQEQFLINNRGSIEYTSACDCWGAGIELGRNRVGGIQVGVIYRFVGLGEDRGLGRGDTRRSGLVESF